MLTTVRIDDYTDYLNSILKFEKVDDLVNFVEKYFENNFPAEYTGIYIFNEETNKLELKFAFGFSEEERKLAESTAMERHPGLVFNTGKGFYTPDVSIDGMTKDSKRSFVVRSRLYEPILIDSKVIGVFGIVSSKVNAFDEFQIKYFRLICKTVSIAFISLIQKRKLTLLNKELLILSYIATKSNHGVILANSYGNITWANDAFLKLTGYSLSEIIGKKPGSFLQGKESDQVTIKHIADAIKNNKEIKDVEIVNYKKNGDKYFILLDIYPFISDEGEQMFISLQKDITKKKIEQNVIRNQKLKFEKIVETLPDAILILGINGIIKQVHSNNQIRKIINLVNPQRKNYKSFISKKYHKAIDDRIYATIRTKKLSIFVIPLILLKVKYYVEVRISIFDKSDVLVVLRDLTEQYKTLKVKKLNDKLSEIISTYSYKLTFIDKLQLEKYIYEMLSESALALKASSIKIHEYINDYRFSRILFEWEKDTGQLSDSCDYLFVNEDMPAWNKRIFLNEIIVFQDTRTLDKNLYTSVEYARLKKSRTIVGIPITVNNIRFGFLFFESGKRVFEITKEILNHLKLITDIVVNSIFRRKWSKEIERSKTYLDNSIIGIVIIDRINEIVYLNKKTLSILNFLQPKSISKLSDLFPYNLCSFELSYDNLIDFNDSLVLTINDAKTGDRFLNFSITKIDDITSLDSNDKNIVLAFTDITTEVVNQNALEKSLDLLNIQNKQLLNFSFMVSHNLRSHASTISSFVELLKVENEETEKQILLKALSRSSKNLEDTLRDMTSLIKTKNQFNLEYSELNFDELVKKILSSIYSEMVDIEHEIIMEFESNLTINTIPSYIESILTNLFTNSFKYRKLGSKLIIKIEAKFIGNKFIVIFSDNGIGIDMTQHKDSIFGLFSTFHNRSNSQGIGLHLVKLQIEKLSGTISVKSEVNVGTEFLIELPSK